MTNVESLHDCIHSCRVRFRQLCALISSNDGEGLTNLAYAPALTGVRIFKKCLAVLGLFQFTFPVAALVLQHMCVFTLDITGATEHDMCT